MSITFFFGPDKIKFSIREKGLVEASSAIPFHGIVSRGVLMKFAEKGISVDLWHRFAHSLFQTTVEGISNDELMVRDLVHEAKALSFGQSAYCAQQYIVRYFDMIHAIDADVELWNIKEGHTSSVWKVTIDSPGLEECFILNISRDCEASKDLKETSEKIMTIGDSFPELNMSKVFEITSLKDDSLPFEPVITKNEWVADSFEVHCRRQKQRGAEEFIFVERFLTDMITPARITSAVGRIFTKEESSKINSDINFFLSKASSCLGEEPSLNINEGDVVWNGEKAVVVALS